MPQNHLACPSVRGLWRSRPSALWACCAWARPSLRPAARSWGGGVNETPGATVDLTAQGVLDWAHWGLNLPTDFDDKGGVTSQISNYIPVGTSADYYQYGGNAQGFTWTDGPGPGHYEYDDGHLCGGGGEWF